MAVYTFHAPPAKVDAGAPADVVAIKDGFCWPALFIPLIWTLYRRLWLVAILYLAGLLLIELADAGGAGPAAAVIYALGRVFYALEANGLRRWTLERRGWRLAGVAEGRRVEDAERRFFAAWEADDLPAAEEAQPPARGASVGWTSPARKPRVVGLFPSPERP